ncbi:MAG: hypothetical protein EB059_11460 [Alphaproteobacteria bacterium]|nr:hypothetical protein [Alphaproteobacteria bacterium]NDE91725.1 hypothetical protein [Alphaproteobacteria bacterium]
MSQAYQGACIIIPTKHAKSIAIAPPFWNHLGASVLEYYVDTDTLGTFSGEVERKGNALECARCKCEWALDLLGDKVEYCIASEGSFGPHPHFPFLPCDQEILYFIDRKRGFHLHVAHVTEKTNYQMSGLESWEQLQQFAESAQFPSHALIVRPNSREDSGVLFKGINTTTALEEAFKESRKVSTDGKVWVETDMRAQFNPSRMAVIGELANKLAQRLAAPCPKCIAPGWGCMKVEKGLHCEYCDQATEMIAHEIYGCVSCDHTETTPRADGLKAAPQMHCGCCNP